MRLLLPQTLLFASDSHCLLFVRLLRHSEQLVASVRGVVRNDNRVTRPQWNPPEPTHVTSFGAVPGRTGPWPHH